MRQLLEWVAIFSIEFFKYIMAYRICTKQRINEKRKTFGLIFVIVVITIFYLIPKVEIETVYIGFVFVSLISVFVCMQEKISERLWKILVIFLSVTAIDSVIEKVTSGILNENLFFSEHAIIIWEVAELISIEIVLNFFKGINHLLKDRLEGITHILVKSAVIFADICLCMCAAFLFLSGDGSTFRITLGTMSFIGVVFLGSQIFVILELNNSLKEVVTQEKLINEMQKEYYQSILRNEEETRKYRHDMNNHFIVLESYLKKNKYEELEKYISELKDNFSNVLMKKYIVGNDLIDAISGYYLSLIDDCVEININGFAKEDMNIDDINLCTIYSNLLKNSVEELQRLKFDGKDELKLTIIFATGKDFFEIKITNTAKNNTLFSGIVTPTLKNNKKEHGIGLSNVKRAVDKEHGNITLQQLDGEICADVIIPIR